MPDNPPLPAPESASASTAPAASAPPTASSSTDAPPPAPVPPAEVKPGRLAKYTQKAIEKALSEIIEGWSYDNFERSFPSVAQTAPETLRAMRDQTMEYFKESVKTSIEELHNRRRVIPALNELDQLLAHADEAREADKNRGGRAADEWTERQRAEALARDPLLAARARRRPITLAELAAVEAQTLEAQATTATLLADLQAVRAELAEHRAKRTAVQEFASKIQEISARVPLEEMLVLGDEARLDLRER